MNTSQKYCNKYVVPIDSASTLEKKAPDFIDLELIYKIDPRTQNFMCLSGNNEEYFDGQIWSQMLFTDVVDKIVFWFFIW
jgi:hypothetical protein